MLLAKLKNVLGKTYMKLNFTVREIVAAVVFVFILLGSLMPLSGNTGAHQAQPPSTLPPAKVIDPNADYIPTVLVTGSNRGIGLEFVKQFSANGWNVIATARKPVKAKELNKLAKGNDKIRVERLDVTDNQQIEKLAKKLEGQPIDVLLNNAGYYGDRDRQDFDNLDQDLFNLIMDINALGPLKVAKGLLPNVKASQQKKILTLSSGLGSMNIGGRMGDHYSYKMSKAALNIGMLTLRSELKKEGVIVQLIAPGMVDTGLLRASKAREGMGITTEESVKGMLSVIDSINKKTKPKMINYNGQQLPW